MSSFRNLVWKIRVFIKQTFGDKIDKKNFGGRENLTVDEGSETLASLICKGEPLSTIRMGFAELALFYEYEEKITNPEKKYKESKMADTFEYSDEQIERYCKCLIAAYENADIIANWYSSRNEENLLRKYAGKAVFASARTVEPYYSQNPWTKALKGKKVLVISPFDSTIASQYKKRKEIWPNGLLPEFELITMRSVWYVGSAGKDSRFNSWFDALDYLKNEVKEIDFDIALLGCGPFGVPLVDYIKSIGKQAVYIGGALQIIFGIKGDRWDNNDFFKAMYNDAWVRPNESDKPEHPEKLDGACYW